MQKRERTLEDEHESPTFFKRMATQTPAVMKQPRSEFDDDDILSSDLLSVEEPDWQNRCVEAYKQVANENLQLQTRLDRFFGRSQLAQMTEDLNECAVVDRRTSTPVVQAAHNSDAEALQKLAYVEKVLSEDCRIFKQKYALKRLHKVRKNTDHEVQGAVK